MKIYIQNIKKMQIMSNKKIGNFKKNKKNLIIN